MWLDLVLFMQFQLKCIELFLLYAGVKEARLTGQERVESGESGGSHSHQAEKLNRCSSSKGISEEK